MKNVAVHLPLLLMEILLFPISMEIYHELSEYLYLYVEPK